MNTSHRHGYGRQRKEVAGSRENCDYCIDEDERFRIARENMGLTPHIKTDGGEQLPIVEGIIRDEQHGLR